MAGFTNRGSFDNIPKAKAKVEGSSKPSRPPNVTIMGQIISVHIESAMPNSNAKRGSSQPHLDYMVIGLTHPVPELELKAEFDETGEPITHLKISAPIPGGGAIRFAS